MEPKLLLVPQMGEGLQEVRVVSLGKKPGDQITRDEEIYTMETDKAIMPIESPYEGTLVEWLAGEGDVLPIGAPIARIQETASTGIEAGSEPLADDLEEATEPQNTPPTTVKFSAASGVPPVPQPSKAVRHGRLSPLAALSGGAPLIPPRTRAYCQERGIGEEEMRHIHASSGKLMPPDVDSYLQSKSTSGGTTSSFPPLSSGSVADGARSTAKRVDAPPFREKQLTGGQRTFVMRIKRSQQLVVPVVIKRSMDWSTVRRVADAGKIFGDVKPSAFQTFAYAIARAAREYPHLRSTMPTDETVREYERVNLGIAVGRPDGMLNVAVVPDADALTFKQFVAKAQSNIAMAREGRDQANESVQLLLTHMPGYEIEDAIPLLVAPAIAVLFIGSPTDVSGQPRVNLTMTFDHRLINGIEAAQFLKTIVDNASRVETWTEGSL